jgi:uncharacterized protein with von Willebrand factor type A (vWA) domain
VNYIRGELSEFDRMAVITFENSAVEVHQLLRMTDENKAYTSSLCQGLKPGGGTSILSGLKAASAMIQRRQTQNPITSVFLLTDGVDGSHVSEKKVSGLLLSVPQFCIHSREYPKESRSLVRPSSCMDSDRIMTANI